MKPRTGAAIAPTSAVRTLTVAPPSVGFWRSLSERSACRPAMMMTKLTTIARTGRRMNRSVKRIGVPSAMFGVRRELRFGLDFVLDGDGHAVAQLERAGADHLLPRAHAVED